MQVLQEFQLLQQKSPQDMKECITKINELFDWISKHTKVTDENEVSKRHCQSNLKIFTRIYLDFEYQIFCQYECMFIYQTKNLCFKNQKYI